MCGIAGILALRDDVAPPTIEQLSLMAGALQHRGPDEFGVYRDRHAGLSHARLSILDLATGQQPLSNEDGTIWITFNGEIFNYVELRTELAALGHRFRTQSDTEVIVHAYESWGDRAFEHFNGQWALAMWNRRSRSLVLARDRLGIRPLYFCDHAGRLYFASEVKAIFAADPGIPREFDPIGFDQVFTFWTTVPPQTVFRGIVELEPGHVRTYASGRVVERRFWSPKFPVGQQAQFRGSLAHAAEVTRAALENATSLRMLRADVPVGSYLSGGLDSSFVAALALRAKGEKFCTFSIRFEDAEYDETRYQRLMAQRLGSEHREVVVSRDDIARVFPAVVAHAERPLLRTAPAPLFLLSGLVRDAGIKVVLTGEGADEMFAGYDLFREAKVRRFWAREPASERRPRLLERLYPYLARSPVRQRAMTRQFFGRDLSDWQSPGFGHGTRWHTTAQLRRLFSAEQQAATATRDVVRELLASLPAEFAQWSPLGQDQYLEVRTLLSGYILSSQGDRMLMAHSVEGRFPFLDRDVVELANSLPASYKLRVLDEKHIVKRAAWDLVPPEIVRRKKQPYRAPDALSFVGQEARDWVADVVSKRALKEAGVFSPPLAAQLLEKCLTRADAWQFSNADNMAVVGIFSTQLLHDQFVKHRPVAQALGTPTTLIDAGGRSLASDYDDKKSP
jgi:asparagine synthase (glutamine-hydrolysing)